MNDLIEQLEAVMKERGIAKLSISSPHYTTRAITTRKVKRGHWQVSTQQSQIQLDWDRGEWKPTLKEALESAVGPLEVAPAQPVASGESLTDLLV